MKERPILFSAPMVRALLDGRKTQTRRVFKPERMQIDSNGRGGFSYDTYAKRAGEIIHTGGGQFLPENWLHYCPYGQPGDRLWVREAWANGATRTMYRAECSPQYTPPDGRWKPSIHMFRKDSRILLEVVSVRVERLQDIGEADAIAEGIAYDPRRDPVGPCKWASAIDPSTGWSDPVAAYRELIESINGAGSWDANPWVWVVQFKRSES